MMTCKSDFKRMMSAASLAISVAFLTAMATLAALRAGASLMPSPM